MVMIDSFIFALILIFQQASLRQCHNIARKGSHFFYYLLVGCAEGVRRWRVESLWEGESTKAEGVRRAGYFYFFNVYVLFLFAPRAIILPSFISNDK